MSRDGQEMVTFTGQGIGHFVGPGKDIDRYRYTNTYVYVVIL
jgi:hypothetical protein